MVGGWYESDRSERQMNVFLHKLFSVNYARRFKYHLEKEDARSSKCAAVRRKSTRGSGEGKDNSTDHSHSPLAAREGGNVHEAAQEMSPTHSPIA